MKRRTFIKGIMGTAASLFLPRRSTQAHSINKSMSDRDREEFAKRNVLYPEAAEEISHLHDALRYDCGYYSGLQWPDIFCQEWRHWHPTNLPKAAQRELNMLRSKALKRLVFNPEVGGMRYKVG